MKANKELAIFGASGHAKVVLSTAKSLGYDVFAFYDDNEKVAGTLICDIPVVGPLSQCFAGAIAIIAIGDNRAREAIAQKYNSSQWATPIHPHSFVDSSVEIGIGSLVCAGAVIQVDAYIGNHCIINTSASVDHDCVIGDFVHIAPGVNLAGNVTVGCGAMIGIGASVLPGIKIGKNSMVGAGSVVICDVPDNAVVVGCPAQPIKITDLVDV